MNIHSGLRKPDLKTIAKTNLASNPKVIWKKMVNSNQPKNSLNICVYIYIAIYIYIYIAK
jgi:hypothetical protein